MTKLIPHLLEQQVSANPTQTLLRTSDREVSYHCFKSYAFGAYEQIVNAGLSPESRIVILEDDYLACYAWMVGVWRYNSLAVPLNINLAEDKLSFIINKVKPAAIVTSRPKQLAELENQTLVLDSQSLIQRDGLFEDSDYNQAGLIMFTSGTTGLPKGALLSLESLSLNARLAAQVTEMTSADNIFINTPPVFTSALSHFLTMLTAGGQLTAKHGFMFGGDLLDQLHEVRATAFGGAPAHLVRFLGPLKDNDQLPSGFHSWVSSGDHMSAELGIKFLERFPGVKLRVLYGLTEVGGRFCYLKPEFWPDKAGAVGEPMPGMAFTICDDQGVAVPPGEVGEVTVQGPPMMESYFREPEVTANCLSEKGFASGDLGRVDKDGVLWLAGRKDDVFKSAGDKISARVIQDAIMSQPEVVDAAVIGLEDELMGMVAFAFVTLKPDVEMKQTQLHRALKRIIPQNHIPKRSLFVDKIPRTGSGKAVKAKLREMAADYLR